MLTTTTSPRARDLTVSDLMTSGPICVSPRVTVARAMSTMQRSDVRHLPVVDARKKLVGIVSDRDLLRWQRADRAEAKVGDVMSADLATVRPGTLAREATGLLLDRKIGALPVVDDDDRLVGIVTETDFLRVAHEALGGRT